MNVVVQASHTHGKETIMSWTLLLGAALEAGFGVIAAAGFEDAVRDLKERLLHTSAKEREAAMQAALDAAVQASGNTTLSPLLHEPRFQEEVVAALIDPVTGFDVAAMAAVWEEQLPAHRLAFRRFFNALERALIGDAIWGPILERYQDLRFQQDVLDALEARHLDQLPQQRIHQLNAQISGSGIIAQEGSVVATSGGVAAGGDINHLVQIVVNNWITEYSGPPPAASLREAYLRETAREANLLPWSVINLDLADPDKGADLRLAEVYTDLDTTVIRHMEREEELRAFMARIHEAERVPIQEMADGHPYLLVMGDPGSGKSTFVKHLTYMLAQANLAEDRDPWLAKLEGWTQGARLPVRVELRYLAVFAAEKKIKTGNAALLFRYLRHWLEEMALEGFAEELLAAIKDEDETLLFLLDGLDEVPTSQRQQIVNMVNHLRSRYGWHRYLVTCRPYAYVGQPWILSGFHETTLAPFSPEQSDRFVENWYRQLAERGRFTAAEAQRRIDDLQRKIKRRDLREMAERPLLLTVITQLHAFGGKLPDDRTELYADAVDLLLKRWEGRADQPDIIEQLGDPNLKMYNLQASLYHVAYQAHRAQQGEEREERTVDIGEGDLRQWLQPHLAGDWNRAGLFVDYIRERAGLLIRHKTDAYTFPHRTFQEFLAACHLIREPNYPAVAVELVNEDRSQWREVFLLAAGHAARTQGAGQAIAAVNNLCPRGVEKCDRSQKNRWLNATLAGEALLEIGLVGVRQQDAGLAVLERVQDWLRQALREDGTLTALERAAAGRVLAKLGDPRAEVLDPLQIEWVEISAGPFIMGSDDGYDDEKPQHTLDLGYAFRISRFPVTNAQFQVFVEDGGYQEARYWMEAQAAGWWRDGKAIRGLYRWKDESKQEIELFDTEEATAPRNFGEPFNLPNHPVVGITWYEALAFSRWLSEQMETKGLLKPGEEATLPSEAEWARAARAAKGRIYPWGEEPDPNWANCKETGLETTSPVGCFPGGSTPSGVEELSGNVWEWTRSLWGTDWRTPEFGYPYDPADGREALDPDEKTRRAVRGASWYNDAKLGRCAVRDWDDPDSWLSGLGFRVVVLRPPCPH